MRPRSSQCLKSAPDYVHYYYCTRSVACVIPSRIRRFCAVLLTCPAAELRFEMSDRSRSFGSSFVRVARFPRPMGLLSCAVARRRFRSVEGRRGGAGQQVQWRTARGRGRVRRGLTTTTSNSSRTVRGCSGVSENRVPGFGISRKQLKFHPFDIQKSLSPIWLRFA